MTKQKTDCEIPFRNRVVLALTRAAGLAATAAALAATLNSQAAISEKKIVGLEIELSRWLPNISASLNSQVESDGRIEGVSISSIFGSQSYSLAYVRGGTVVPNFNGEKLLGFGVVDPFDTFTGGTVNLVFKAASSVGGGCRSMKMRTYKTKPGNRLYAYHPVTNQPLAALKIAAPEDGSGHRSITEVVLTDSNGKSESVGIARLPSVRCPW